MNIDTNATAVHISAPQDKKIAELGVKLNDTYLAYGAHGRESLARQKEQDKNAKLAAQGSLQQRALSKSSQNYRNARWDMVDALKEKSVKLEEMKDEDLPEEMRKLKPAERRAYVEKKAAERKKISEELLALTKKRETYVAAKRKELSEDEDDTLGAAVTKAVRDQAGKKAITFDTK